jgi:D-sedoheptulose 7-phosphate isomerase
MNWNEYSLCLNDLLSALVITDRQGTPLPMTEGFYALRRMTQGLKTDWRALYLIGNGASASMASHVAADMGKNAGVRTEVFTDLALITALANDICYEEVFAEPLRNRMRPGDMLAAISSSGNSRNILRAAEETERLGGTVITFSAMNPDNPLRHSGRLNFYIPARTYGTAEICHTAMLHYWIDLMVRASGNGNQPW